MAGRMRLACACLLLSMLQLASKRLGSENGQLKESEGEVRWKFCPPWSTTSAKQYHFEIEPEKDSPPAAILLERTAKNPIIKIYKDHYWRVQFSPLSPNREYKDPADIEISLGFHPLQFGRHGALSWKPTPMPQSENQSQNAKGQEGDIHSLQLDKNAIIMYRQDAGHENGMLAIARQGDVKGSQKNWHFFWNQDGGNYFSDELVYRNLEKMMNKETQTGALRNLSSASAVAQQSGLDAARHFFENSIAIGGNSLAAPGAVGGGVAAVCCLGLLSNMPVYLGYGLGMTSGKLIGLGVGLAGAIPVGISQSILSYFKYAREGGLSMAEKIYEKMRCHPSFKECKELEKQGKWVLVHKDTNCTRIVTILLGPDGLATMNAAFQ